MGVGIRDIHEALAHEAYTQSLRRPPTRPRAPPRADNEHTDPLWSEHLQTYVSYSWRDLNWKRWSTTAKIWKIIPDIDGVIAAESKLQNQEMDMPHTPPGPGWSAPLWYQAAERLVSYNSVKGDWMVWRAGRWENPPWWSPSPKMKVSGVATDRKEESSDKKEEEPLDKREGEPPAKGEEFSDKMEQVFR